MNDLRTLKTQRAELDAQIKDAEAAHFNNVLADMIHAADAAGIELRELAAALTTEANCREEKPVRKMPIKFRHTVSGATWSGCGRKPRWFTADAEAAGLIEDLRQAV